MKKPKRKSAGKGQKKVAEQAIVGPEGQGFAGYDARPAEAKRREENPATNQYSNPKPKEETDPREQQDFPRDFEDRRAPDYRHN